MDASGAVALAPPRPVRRGAGTVYFELLVTVGLFAIPAIVGSARAFVNPVALQTPGHPAWGQGNFLIVEVLIVCLLAHVVRMNGETITVFTRPVRASDLAWVCALLVAHWLVYQIVTRGLYVVVPGLFATGEHLRRPSFITGQISPLFVAMLLVNPFCEELAMRGLLQTRLTQLDWSPALVVATSATVQAAYHRYQGIPAALAIEGVFLVFASFYQTTRRLWPVVATHLIWDVLLILMYPR